VVKKTPFAASFAGPFRSFLSRDITSLLEVVHDCWAYVSHGAIGVPNTPSSPAAPSGIRRLAMSSISGPTANVATARTAG
jgi:hypothetical protein